MKYILTIVILLVIVATLAFVLVKFPVNTSHSIKYTVDEKSSEWSNKQILINEVSAVGHGTYESNIDLKQHSTKYTVDGKSSDWSNKQILINEVGAVGHGTFESNIDLKQLYLDNDNLYLYLFIKCEPGLTTRFKTDQRSGILAYLYFDLDQDKSTGSNEIDDSGNKAMLGTETKIWLPLGSTISYPSEKISYTVSYDISKWNPGKGDFDTPSLSADSNMEPELISYTDEGVEIAIPIKSLNLSFGNKFDFVCCEWANNTPDKANREEIMLQE